LVERLDQEHTGPTAALWYFYDDADEWRLLLASPEFDKLLPKQEPVAYRNVIETIGALHLASLGPSDLRIVPTAYPLLDSLKRLIKTGPNAITRAYFTNTTINRIFVKDMVVLRST
jgi:hypothetical protein